MELKVLGLKLVCWVQWTFPTEFKHFLSSSLNQSFFLLSKKCKDCSKLPWSLQVEHIKHFAEVTQSKGNMKIKISSSPTMSNQQWEENEWEREILT